ncbi:hypothetical protein B0H19DRAFT_1386477, partial [Mycena capillaripes]
MPSVAEIYSCRCDVSPPDSQAASFHQEPPFYGNPTPCEIMSATSTSSPPSTLPHISHSQPTLAQRASWTSKFFYSSQVTTIQLDFPSTQPPPSMDRNHRCPSLQGTCSCLLRRPGGFSHSRRSSPRSLPPRRNIARLCTQRSVIGKTQRLPSRLRLRSRAGPG